MKTESRTVWPLFVRIIVRQLAHRWGINLLLLLTTTAVVALYVFILNTNRFTIRSMQLIMKNMGLNQFIIPAGANPVDTLLCTDRQREFAADTTAQLAAHTELLSRYYLSVLQQRVTLHDQPLILTGIQPVSRVDETEEKGNPVKPVRPGAARLGSVASRVLKARQGSRVTVLGKEFIVDHVLPEQGTLDDGRLFLNLADLQNLLGKPGQINVIRSFECLHVGGTLEHIHQYQRDKLAQSFPELQQFNLTAISQGRYYSRNMTERYQGYLVSLAAALTVLIFSITGLQEVAERKYETGVLLAQGTGYAYIIGLYLGKTLGLSLLAAVAGFVIGGYASLYLTTPFLVTQTREIAILWALLPGTAGLIAGTALVAELVPMIKLVRLDPCAILMEE